MLLLKNCVPSFITEEIEDFEVIYKIQQEEIDKLNQDIKEAFSQFFVYRATWGIQDWETFLNIIIDNSKTLEERQATVIAKLRGQGTSTVEQIKNVCLAFVDNVEIVEHNPESYFDTNVILNGELPYTLDSMYSAIDEIKPAHLDVNYNILTISNGRLGIGTVIVAQEKITIYPQEVF